MFCFEILQVSKEFGSNHFETNSSKWKVTSSHKIGKLTCYKTPHSQRNDRVPYGSGLKSLKCVASRIFTAEKLYESPKDKS